MIYNRRVQFYETDKMQCTHHSNYIRFMEEARLDFLDKIGYSYARMEREGLISPVLKVNVEYKHTTTFDDMIEIDVRLNSLTPVRNEFAYTMRSGGKVICIASSQHCFLDKNFRPISIKKVNPPLYELLERTVEKE